MFTKAMLKRASCKNCADSKAKVEKVVKAPRKPTVTISRVSGLSPARCSARAPRQPNRRQPNTFTASVPTGKPAACQRSPRPLMP